MRTFRAALWVALVAAFGLVACNSQSERPGTGDTTAPTTEAAAPPAEGAATAAVEGPAMETTKTADQSAPTPATVAEAFTEASSPLVPVKLIAEAVDSKAVDILFLDARVTMDFDSGHIPGAVNVPYFEAEKHISELPKDKWIVAYCECPTAEAKQVADVLANNGFTKVKIMQEGLQGWKEMGRALDAKPVTAVTPMPGAAATP